MYYNVLQNELVCGDSLFICMSVRLCAIKEKLLKRIYEIWHKDRMYIWE